MSKIVLLLLTPFMLAFLVALALSYRTCEKFYKLECYLTDARCPEPFAAIFFRDFVDN